MASSPKKPAKKAPKARAKPAVRDVSENEIHLKAWQWVSKTYPALLIFHVANERNAPVQAHVKLKRKGVLSGVADFLAFPVDGRKVAIELKEPNEGEQKPDQIKFQQRWERTGGSYFVIRTLEEFQGTINAITLFG